MVYRADDMQEHKLLSDQDRRKLLEVRSLSCQYQTQLGADVHPSHIYRHRLPSKPSGKMGHKAAVLDLVLDAFFESNSTS
jgi:hypothetical protein